MKAIRSSVCSFVRVFMWFVKSSGVMTPFLVGEALYGQCWHLAMHLYVSMKLHPSRFMGIVWFTVCFVFDD